MTQGAAAGGRAAVTGESHGVQEHPPMVAYTRENQHWNKHSAYTMEHRLNAAKPGRKD